MARCRPERRVPLVRSWRKPTWEFAREPNDGCGPPPAGRRPEGAPAGSFRASLRLENLPAAGRPRGPIPVGPRLAPSRGFRPGPSAPPPAAPSCRSRAPGHRLRRGVKGRPCLRRQPRPPRPSPHPAEVDVRTIKRWPGCDPLQKLVLHCGGTMLAAIVTVGNAFLLVAAVVGGIGVQGTLNR